MLFPDVRSFLIVMTGDGAVKRGGRGHRRGQMKQVVNVVKRSREQREQQMESIIVLIFGKKTLFPFQRLLSINLAPYQASTAGL